MSLEVKADFQEGVSVCHTLLCTYTPLEVKCNFFKGSLFAFPSLKNKKLSMKTLICKEFMVSHCSTGSQPSTKALVDMVCQQFATVFNIK